MRHWYMYFAREKRIAELCAHASHATNGPTSGALCASALLALVSTWTALDAPSRRSRRKL